MAKRLFQVILISMILGVVAGAIVHRMASAEQAAAIASYLKIVTDIFLRLIKMIIAPLVLTTLIVGIAHMRDSKALGRVGLRTMIWFVCASLFSLGLGLLLVNIIKPGEGFDAGLSAGAAAAPEVAKLSLADFITHLVPRSIIEAMATNEILQIVIFSVFAGVALAKLGEKTAKVVELTEQVAYVMLKITEYVMLLAPFAVFAALAGVVAIKGLGGFHLAPHTPEYQRQTLTELQALKPDLLIPMHCSGESFISMVQQAMPDRFVRSSTGTRFIFSA